MFNTYIQRTFKKVLRKLQAGRFKICWTGS